MALKMQKRHAATAKTVQRQRVQAKRFAKKMLGPIELPSLKTEHSERFVWLEPFWIGKQYLLVETGSLGNPARPTELLCVVQQLLGQKQIWPGLLADRNQRFRPLPNLGDSETHDALHRILVVVKCSRTPAA